MVVSDHLFQVIYMNKDIKNETDTFISNSIDVKMRTAIKPESIPLKLKCRDQWLLFKLALVDGKLKKYPFTVRNRSEGWNLAKTQTISTIG